MNANSNAGRGETTVENIRIFLIEDVDDVRESYTLLLQMCGCEVIQFSDGRDAVAQLELDNCLPHAAIIDLNVPSLNGFQIARRIRESATHRHMILASLTGNNDLGVRDQALAVGFDLYFQKPISIRKVLAEIRKLLALEKSWSP